MAARFTEEARAIPMLAFELAIGLGNDYLGGEHFLLALASIDQPAGAVLRERGVTPERVEAEIISRSSARLFEDLDRDALAVIGIDVDAVRASVETRFGPAAVSQAAQAAERGRGGFSRVLDNVRPRSGAQRDGVSCRMAPVRCRASKPPAMRRGPVLSRRPGWSTWRSASSPSARDWYPLSCQRSACRHLRCAARSRAATGRRADQSARPMSPASHRCERR